MRGLGVLSVSDCALPSVDQKMRAGTLIFSSSCLRLDGSPRRLGGRAPVGACSWWFPFTCGWAVIGALRAARERTPCGVWLLGVVALVAYAVSGRPVTVPVRRGCGVSLFLVGRFAARIAVCPLGCLFVGCALPCRVLPVCCGLFCLSAIVWCAFRERACVWCDVVHAGWCGRAFDCDRGCRLLFTV